VATVTSFATTTGYVSMDWASAQNWSGLSNPTLMLLGLAALGGGVASTAGGIKLFRAFALFQHGIRDLGHLSHPRVIDRPRRPGGRLDRAAVTNAWVFTMLFLAALSVTLLALTLSGMQFDRALIGAISALANTGPAFPLVEQDPAAYAKLPTTARMLLCAAMVLGRIEVLAVVALLNPSWWRR
jgi:trk system potassium uptake protein TrkH